MFNPFCRHAWKILSSTTIYSIPEALWDRITTMNGRMECVLTVITVCDKCGAIKKFTEKTGGY